VALGYLYSFIEEEFVRALKHGDETADGFAVGNGHHGEILDLRALRDGRRIASGRGEWSDQRI
jgi:hypothetical protein